MPHFTAAEYVFLTVVVACIPTALLVLGFLVRVIWQRRQRRRFSRSITLLYQILDGRGYGMKDEGTKKKGKQCVPRPWLLERAAELEKELKALKIRVPNVARVPARAHLVGCLFRLKELLESRNLKEARRFGHDFTESLHQHPWDHDGRYVCDTDSTVVEVTALEDDFVNSRPT